MGGYLAVSITDTIQGFLIAFTAVVMPVTAIIKLGGISELIKQLATVTPEFSSLTAGT